MCPLCNANYKAQEEIGSGMYRCSGCGTIHGSCYAGDRSKYVKPFFAKENVSPEKWRYYDFEILGSNGVSRVHGWFDPETQLITQVG